jgi:hypothetical protein
MESQGPTDQTIDGCIEQRELCRGKEKNKSARDTDIMAPQSEKSEFKNGHKIEKSTSTMRLTTIYHDFPYSVAVEGLQNDNFFFSIYHETNQNCGRRGVFSNDRKSQL